MRKDANRPRRAFGCGDVIANEVKQRFSIIVSAWSPLAAALSKFESNQFDPGPALPRTIAPNANDPTVPPKPFKNTLRSMCFS